MTAKTVEFKFSPKDKVKDAFGNDGIVYICAIEENKQEPVYYVKNQYGGNWIGEEELLAAGC
jgi:hypothetical protein